MRRAGLLEQPHRGAGDRPRVHVRAGDLRQRRTRSNSWNSIQDIRFSCDIEFREPLQPEAAGNVKQAASRKFPN